MRKVVVLTVAFLALYIWRLPQAFYWDSDWGRDLYDTIKIAQGDFALIGPTLTGAVFAGPYYYYFLVPPLVLSAFNESAVLVFNAVVFAAAIGVVAKKYGVWAALAVGVSPFWLSAARHPGNAFSYFPLLLIIMILGWEKKLWKKWQVLAWGGLAGMVLNFHPITLLIIGPMAWRLTKVSKSLLWMIGLIASFGPLVLFELIHDGIMTNAVISGKFWRLAIGKVGESIQWHYLAPVSLAFLFFLCVGMKKKRNALVALTIVWIIFMPYRLFAFSERGGNLFANGVSKVLGESWPTAGKTFNLLSIVDEEKLVVSGNEYRYFFAKEGYLPLDVSNYRSADELLIFSEQKDLEISQLKMWELEEFKNGQRLEHEVINGAGLRIYRVRRAD